MNIRIGLLRALTLKALAIVRKRERPLSQHLHKLFALLEPETPIALFWHLRDIIESTSRNGFPAKSIRTAHSHRVNGSFGVNVAGYLTGGFGLAEAARCFVLATKLAKIPHALNTVFALNQIANERRYAIQNCRDNPYPINLHCIELGRVPSFFGQMGAQYFRGRKNVGVWFWELPNLPKGLDNCFNRLDEVWTCSDFVARSVSKATSIPVKRVTFPLFVDSAPRAVSKSIFGLRETSFVFLFMFDMLSVFERKNPLSLIRAFKEAFSPAENAFLVIDCINSKWDRESLKRMKSESADHNIIIAKRPNNVSNDSAIAACDCYVSLHRSEGLGIPMAKAMYLKKPVIATAYSGNMDFMNRDNGFLVGYRLVELDRDYGPFERGSVWAEPSISDAADLTRFVFDNKDEAAGIASVGSRDVKRLMDPVTAAREIREGLWKLYTGTGASHYSS